MVTTPTRVNVVTVAVVPVVPVVSGSFVPSLSFYLAEKSSERDKKRKRKRESMCFGSLISDIHLD